MSFVERKAYREVPYPLSAEYVVGLTDGEGSFCFILNTNNNYRVTPRFAISLRQHARVLNDIKQFFGIGSVQGKLTKNFEVSGLEGCLRIEKFFLKHKLRVKAEDFEKWRLGLRMLEKGEHLTKEGLLRFIELRDTMNLRIGKKRTYPLEVVLEKLRENPKEECLPRGFRYIRYNKKQYSKALKLSKKGFSTSAISKIINVPAGTVWHWVKGGVGRYGYARI